MLRSIRSLTGYTLRAHDGDFGSVKDLYFDDQYWGVRYLVADTATWLFGRLVLISPESMGQPDWATKTFPIDLTKEQIERSPSIHSDQPVSLHQEQELRKYYRWPSYWGIMASAPGVPETPDPSVTEDAESPADQLSTQYNDPHLRSTLEVIGYTVQASNGGVGLVQDFIIDDETWVVQYIIVNTGSWLSNRDVIVSPKWAEQISWKERRISLDMTQNQIEESPQFDPSKPVNREYEITLYDYYGRPQYWDR